MGRESELPAGQDAWPDNMRQVWMKAVEDVGVPSTAAAYLRRSSLSWETGGSTLRIRPPISPRLLFSALGAGQYTQLQHRISELVGRHINLHIEDDPSMSEASSSGLGSPAPAPSIDALAVFQRQIGELTAEVARLSRPGEGEAKPQSRELAEIRERIEAISDAGQALAAPVYLPPSEDMAVRLVSAGSLDRLEEYHSDEALYMAVGSLFAGGVIGMLVNMATQVVPKGESAPPLPALFWVVLVIMAIAALIFFIRVSTTRSRIKTLKQKTLNPSGAAAVGGDPPSVEDGKIGRWRPVAASVPRSSSDAEDVSARR